MMAIKILNVKDDGKGGGQDDRKDHVAEITHGYGQVPNYTALDGVAVRSDDPDVIDAIVEAFPEAEAAEFDGKRPFYALFPEGFALPLEVDFVRTELALRNRNFDKVRSCDGETQSEGEACICAKQWEFGTPEWRKAINDGLACGFEGFLYASIAGVDLDGPVLYSKSSESTVRPIGDLEAAADGMGRFSTRVELKTVESKKTGHRWSVGKFSKPVEITGDEPF
jgi:hypothetical protein